MKERGNEVKERGNEVKERGTEVKERGNEVKVVQKIHSKTGTNRRKIQLQHKFSKDIQALIDEEKDTDKKHSDHVYRV